MKRGLCIVAFLVLAAQLSLWGYDTSPSREQIIPEAVWAAATGGGTWVTEIQITSLASTPADVNVQFSYSGGIVGPFEVSHGLAQNQSVRFANILATLDALDSSGFVYYGRAGALWIQASNINSRIQVQAKTVNGNYGKTFPGLNIVAGHGAAYGRPMLIQDLVQNSIYRTFVGAFNSDDLYSGVVNFRIVDAQGVQVGSVVEKTLLPLTFVSFNPFAAAGVPSGTYENCHLVIEVIMGGTGVYGLFCFGSIGNNYTNDTYALIARMYN